MPRISAALLQKRINYVYRELLEGALPSDLCRFMTDTWKVTNRTAERYISRAQDKIKSEAKAARKDLFEYHFMARRQMRKEVWDLGLHRLAHQILKDEAELFGLYAPKEIIVTWQEQARAAGYDPDAIYSQLVKEWTTAMVAGNDEPGLAGGPPTSTATDRTSE